MERVSDEWLNHTIKNGVDRTIGDYYKVLHALEELQVRRKAEKEQGHTDNSASEKDGAGETKEKAVLPIPCTKGFEDWTVKDYFQKINEELDEVKDAILSIVELEWKPEGGTFAENDVNVIAEEAADTITAITSMLEAMGITEHDRQEAQRRVNEHNRQRGRC